MDKLSQGYRKRTIKVQCSIRKKKFQDDMDAMLQLAIQQYIERLASNSKAKVASDKKRLDLSSFEEVEEMTISKFKG